MYDSYREYLYNTYDEYSDKYVMIVSMYCIPYSISQVYKTTPKYE